MFDKMHIPSSAAAKLQGMAASSIASLAASCRPSQRQETRG